MVNRITIFKKRMNKGRSDCSGSSKVKSVTDLTEVANVIIAGARKEGNFFGKR